VANPTGAQAATRAGGDLVNRRAVSPLPVVAVVVAALVAALLLGEAKPGDAPAAAEIEEAAALTPAGTRSSAWFCPGPPASIPLEGQHVSVTNIGDDPADVVVTVSPDDGTDAVSQAVTVDAGTVARLARPDLGPVGGVTVESFGRDVLVEAGVESGSDLALGPCASAANADWYFAAGTTGNFEPNTTGRPVEQWLVLFNPFGSDARVDVTLRTTDTAVPDQLAPIDVPRRTRVLVPIHERAVRTPQVAVQVHATVGRVVAEQTMIFGEASGYTGLTRSLGAVAPAAVWTFADGSAATGTRTVIAVVNPGLVDTEIDVLVSAAPTPVTVPVARDAVVWIPIGDCGDPPAEGCVAVPPDTSYSVSIVTDVDTPVVAEQFATYNNDAWEGVATLMGTSRPTTTALLGRAAVADDRSVWLAVANPGAVAVRASVAVVRPGGREEPADLQDVEVPPGQHVSFDLANVLGTEDAAVVVTATGAVVLGRSLNGANDISRSAVIAGRQ
jgi:hypothetical protein